MNNFFTKLRKSRLSSGTLAVVLALSILLSTFSGLFIFADNNEGQNWDGTPASGFEKGSGTQTDPYLVSTPAELKLAVTSTGLGEEGEQLYYKMVNDIYVNDVTGADWKSGAVQWPVVTTTAADKDTAFKGIFNGCGYKVFGLYVSKSYTAPETGPDLTVATGLFPAIADSASITAVGVENSWFSLTNDCETAAMAYVGYVGGIAGYVHNSSSGDPVTIDRCYVGADVQLTGAVAGLVGGIRNNRSNDNDSPSVVVTNCYGLASASVYVDSNTYKSNRFMLVSGVKYNAVKLDYTYSVQGIAWSGALTDTKANYGGNWVSGSTGVQLNAANMKGAKAFNESVDTDGNGTVDKAEKYMTLLKNSGAFMLTDSYPVLRVFLRTSDGEKLWDGSETAPTVGEGTEIAPYIIFDPAELAYVIKSGGAGKHYKLANNIYLNDIARVDWTTGTAGDGYTPNEWYDSSEASSFEGTIDGNGYIVYGIYYKNTAEKKESQGSAAGLVPTVSGKVVTVKNLGIDASYVEHPYNAGLFVGFNNKGSVTVDSCFAGAQATVSSYFTGAVIGASNSYISVTNSYSVANIQSVKHTGLVGDLYRSGSTSFKDTSIISKVYNANGPVHSKEQITPTNSYATVASKGVTLLNAEQMKGITVVNQGGAMSGLGEAFIGTVGYPILDVFKNNLTPEEVPGTEGTAYWTGETVAPTAGGDGASAATAIELSTPEELAYVVANGGEGKYYKLTKDIYLNDTEKIDWTTGTVTDSEYTAREWYYGTAAGGTKYAGEKTFTGHIDGAGHTVYGLYYKPGNTYTLTGLIPASSNTTVSNLQISSSFVSGGRFTGVLLGYAKNATVNSCVIDTTVTAWGYNAATHESTGLGGIAGYIDSSNITISDVAVYATFKSSDFDFSALGLTVGKVNDAGAILGTTWKATITVTDAVSLAPTYVKGNDRATSRTFTDVYTVSDGSAVDVNKVTKADITGATAAEKLTGLDFENTWKAGAYIYPTLIQFYDESKDVAENAPTPAPTPDPDPEPEPDPEDTPKNSKHWNGTDLEAPYIGEGTEASPLEIANAKQLAYVIKTGGAGKYYKLTADIYLNDLDKIDWKTGVHDELYIANSWFNLSNSEPFSGTLDGDGHVIYGLYYNDTADKVYGQSSASGLIPGVLGEVATVKNLGIESSYISNPNQAGLIVGFNNRGQVTIDQCYVGADAFVSSYDTGAFIGTANSQFIITNSYSLATVESAHHTGIIGDAYTSSQTTFKESSVVRCVYNAKGPISSKGVSNTNSYATVESKGANLRTPENMQGRDVFSNTDKMILLVTGLAFQATDTYPILRIFSDDPSDVPELPGTDNGPIWDGSTALFFAEGKGTENDPYIITKGSELKLAIETGSGLYYKLANDIYLNDVNVKKWYESTDNNEWINGTVFSGHIDGNGYIVYGVWYPADNEYQITGLIPNLSSGSVKNLGVRYSYVHAKRFTGGIIGRTSAGGVKTIDQCFTDETVTVGYTENGYFGAGGIIGYVDGDNNSTQARIIISNSYSKATITGGDANRTNGLIGSVWKSAVKVINSYSARFAPYFMNSHGTISSLYWDYGSGTNYTNGAAGLVDINTVISGVYTESGAEAYGNNFKKLASEDMRGTAAATAMSAFDFETIWETVEGGTPKLRIFTSINGKDIDTSGYSDVFELGSGTKAAPFVIENAEQLRFAIENGGGKYYKLSKDIYLNDVTDKLWYENENNNEWLHDVKFSGHIDGDGHCVYGIWYPADNEYQAAGLIPNFSGGSVKNLGVRYSYIFADRYAGGIAGRTTAGSVKSFETSFVDDSVQVGYTSAGNYGAGGIVGYVDGDNTSKEARVIINNCYSKAVISGADPNRTNGLLGTVWKTAVKVTNSYSVNAQPYIMKSNGTVSALYWDYSDTENKYTTGAAGLIDINTIINGIYADSGSPAAIENYTVVDVTDSRIAAKQRSLMPALDFENIWQTVEGGTPKLKIFASVDGKDIDISKDSVIFSGGTGKENDPYIIKTVEQLRYLVESTNTKNKHYKLANDIYINDTSKKNWLVNSPKTWYELAPGEGTTFNGTLDGNGHYIYGIYVNSTPSTEEKMNNTAAGLFPRISMYATIKNVHIRSSYLSGIGYTGSIAGFINASGSEFFGRLIGCSADETVVVKGQTAGGLVGGGGRSLEIQYAYFTGTVEATSEGRGNALVGDIWNSQQRVVQAYSIGYQNYRNGFVPANVIALYGTVAQNRTTVVEEKNMYGSAAKKAMPELDWDIWYTVNGKTPHMKVISDDMLATFVDEGVKGRVWSGKLASKFAGGTGTETDPYLIETPEQMAYLVYNSANTKGLYYKLMADLKLNDTSKADWEKTANYWLAVTSTFTGNFDGNGHVISGLYFSGENATIALFPKIGPGAVIKRVGITQSTLISSTGDGKQSYVAALVGQNSGTGSADTPENFNYPVISQCFADDSVYLEGMFVGGIVCGNPRGLYMDNCYFTGEITAESHCGTLIGNSWHGYPNYITNCYAVSLDRDPVGSNGTTNFVVSNVYIDGRPGNFSEVIRLSVLHMKGDEAKTSMPELDYVNIWKTVENGTPVLRCFANAEKYASQRDPLNIEISFATEGGEVLDSIFGFAGSEIGELPTPTYYGYEFKGWYVNQYKIIPFELKTFPDQDMVIYAKWEKFGFDNGFEGSISQIYDINEGIEIFRPGVSGYNPKYIHAGMRTLRTIAESTVDPVFLINYEYPLEVGKEYDIHFWIYVSGEAAGTIDALHAQHPQKDSPVVGYEKMFDLANVEEGKWVRVSDVIVANAPYILIRTTKGSTVYYDDFQIVPTGKDGELGKLDGFNPDNINAEPDGGLPIVWIIVMIAGGVALLGAIATVTVILIKKKKKTA